MWARNKELGLKLQKNEPRIANKHRDFETQRIRGLNRERERHKRIHIQAHRITNLRPMKINI